MRATRALAAILACTGIATGCSKDADSGPTHSVTMGARTLPPPTPTADDTAESPERPAFAPHIDIVPKADEPLTYTVTVHVDAAPPKVDPDLPVMAAARESGAACFTGITDGSKMRSATIRVTVLPSGSVSRSEVSSGSTKEAWVLSCLENVGSGLHFSDKPTGDIRTYSIGVTVTLAH